MVTGSNEYNSQNHIMELAPKFCQTPVLSLDQELLLFSPCHLNKNNNNNKMPDINEPDEGIL